MQVFMKIFLIVVAILIAGAVLGLMKESRGGGGYGALGVIITMALFVEIKAIWSYDINKLKEKNTNEIDKLEVEIGNDKNFK